MTRRGGWRREGSRGRFRYLDARGNRIVDPAKVARVESLVIPPAWREVWISPRANAKLQATGLDAAGRRQYLYHPDFRAEQEQAKYDRLIGFAERLPDLRTAMAEHIGHEPLDRERVSAVAVRLIDLGWFRVGSDRYARDSRTYGITTLNKSHVSVRGSRIVFRFRGKHRAWVRTAILDAELAAAMRELQALRGARRLFRYEWEGGLYNLTSARLNDYIRIHLGQEFTAKDFRTWGGTLTAAIALAERRPAETAAERQRAVAAVMRRVGERLGNTPAVARASYVSPAVVEQYLDGRTIEDFRPRHLRVVRAREVGLDPEETALLSLLRSWRIRRARRAA
ncbi:MAG: DNA topoisomerase IB [Gaiellaceae bacterium]